MFIPLSRQLINYISTEGRRNKVKILLLGMLALISVLPVPARAEVNVSIGIPLPPPIILPVPPPLIPIPQTNVYVAPDAREDIFFHKGWWWRPWNGHWYRSRSYNAGWAPCHNPPPFHSRIPANWRDDYRRHNWKGHPWNYQHVPHQQVQKNWHAWEKNRHWERHNNWGVEGMKHQPHREMRQAQVHQARGFEAHHNGHGPAHGHGHGHP